MTTVDDLFRDEEPEAKAERLEEEAKDRLYIEQLAEIERQRQAEREHLRDAMRTVEHANPQMLADERYRHAVAGTPLLPGNLRPPPGPSLGGLAPAQMELVERQAKSAEMVHAADQAKRERWVNDQQQTIKNLQAGQEPSQQAAIQANFRAQKGGS